MIASANIGGNGGGLKSQTLQFQTGLGTDFLDLFAKEEGDDDDDDGEGDNDVQVEAEPELDTGVKQ